MLRAAVIVFAMFCAALTPAQADFAQAQRDFRARSYLDRYMIQWSLTWTGDYNRLVDADFRRATYDAIQSFQKRNGFAQTGALSAAQLKRLEVERDRIAGVVGFDLVDDPNAKMSVGVPLDLTPKRTTTKRGSHWEAEDGSAALDTILVPEQEVSFEVLFERMKAMSSDKKNTYSTNLGDQFIVSGIADGKKFYTRMHRTRFGSRGISFSWDVDVHPNFDALSLALASSQFDLDGKSANATPTAFPKGERFIVIASRLDADEAILAAEGYQSQFKSLFVAKASNGRYAIVLGPVEAESAKAIRDRLRSDGRIPDDSFVSDGTRFLGVVWTNSDKNQSADEPKSASKKNMPKEPSGDTSTGSGFFVSEDGHMLTNAHVAGDCRVITVTAYGRATLVRKDEANDLAMIRINSGEPKAVATFQEIPVRAGATIMVVGYPLSQVLGSAFNITAGMVSSLSGIGGDTRYFQFTAPLQPGNSGGAVLDATGKVVGVATAKLNDLKMIEVAGSLPQNVNFALGSGAVQAFLRATGIPVKTEAGGVAIKAEDIADNGSRFSAQVICEQ